MNNTEPPKEEAEPCLDRPSVPKPRVTFLPAETGFERWARQRTGLTRLGLLVLAVLLFLLVVFAVAVVLMAVLWPSIPHSFHYPSCRSAACLEASAQMVSKMNSSSSACSDLREFACGSWLGAHPLPRDKSIWGAKQYLQHKHREKIRDVISTMTTHIQDLEKVQWKIKNLYDSCMSVGSIETEGNRPLKKVITALGGWHVLRHFSLNAWDMKKAWRLLYSKYNVQPFFKVEVVPDPANPVQSIIQISPGNLGLPSRQYYKRRSEDIVVIAYKRYLKDVAINLGATSDDAASFAEDLFGFEKRLAERFPSTILHQMPNPSYRQTIAKLQQIAPSIPLIDILSAMFPDAKLNMKTEVMVIASDHLVNVSRTISATDRNILNEYMMWRLAVSFVPYLSKDFTNTEHEFVKHLYGNKASIPRWEMCVETVQKFAGLGIETILENHHSQAHVEANDKLVQDIFNQIKGAMIKTVEKSSKLQQHVKDHFLDKMKSLTCQVGLPGSMKSSGSYNSYYGSLTTIKDDFFNNILYGVSFLMEEQAKRLKEPAEDHRWVDVISTGELRVAYVPEINRIIVPYSLLSSPFFHSQYPPAVTYGSLGAEIGLAIVEAITGRGLFHSGDGSFLQRDHPVANMTNDCFLHHPSPVPRLEALKITYQAMKSVIEKRPHLHQPALEHLEDPAVFFISYAQSMCTVRTRERFDIDVTLNSQVDDITFLDKVMSKSNEFKETFGCHRPTKQDVCDSLI